MRCAASANPSPASAPWPRSASPCASGQIAAVIGPNGAGKSTLFNLITGHLQPTSGRVLLDGRDITGVAPHRICGMGMGRSFQRTNIFPKLTVFENVQAAFLAHRGHGRNFWSRSERALPR